MTKTHNSPALMEVFVRIAAERQRQRELFRAGQITLDMASPAPDANRKLRVLVEEVGEVAEALDVLEAMPKNRNARRLLHAELTQVAAVSVAWLESLETNHH